MWAKSTFYKTKHGFTLIELLIVIVIIGIIASFALLAFGDFGYNRRVKAAAEEFKHLIELSQQQAILQPMTLGIEITQREYRFYQYQWNSINHQYDWQLLTKDTVLKPHALPSNTYFQLIQPSDTGMNTPQITISSSGDITPFVLKIKNSKEETLWEIMSDNVGSVKLKSFTAS